MTDHSLNQYLILHRGLLEMLKLIYNINTTMQGCLYMSPEIRDTKFNNFLNSKLCSFDTGQYFY